MMNRRIAGPIALACAAFLSACSSTPTAITSADVLAQSKLDRAKAQEGVEPVQNAVTLEEAVARALKYNLERRTKLMETAVAMNQYDVSKYDMLPKFMAQAGYSYRNNDRIASSMNAQTGVVSVQPSISSENEHHTTDLGLSWNLLDFGVSYINAKQNGDRALIAAERRRKATHTLIQDVIGAFWRTASAQKLNASVKTAILSAEGALADARKAEREGLRSPLDSLKYQRQLLENIKLLEGVEQELASARIELANLMNVPLVVDLKVVEPAENLATKIMALPIEELEDVAVDQNADLREQFYGARISAQESKKILLKLFPNLNFSYGTKYDSDSYLTNHRWQEAGAQLSFNIFNLLSAPAQFKLADAGVALAEQRRIATQMAMLAQLHIARLQYANTLQQFNRADAIWVVDDKINKHTVNREKAQAQSKLEAVANNTQAILSQLRRYQALSNVHAASGKLQASLGLEPEIGSVHELSLSELTEAVRKSFQDWQAGVLPKQAQLPVAAPVAEAAPAPAAEPAKAEAKPVEAPKVAEEVKPAEAPKVVEDAKQVWPVKPVEDVKPIEPKADVQPATESAPKAEAQPAVEIAPKAEVQPAIETAAVEAPKLAEEAVPADLPKVSEEAAPAAPIKSVLKSRFGRHV